jgi:hypothetical protein
MSAPRAVIRNDDMIRGAFRPIATFICTLGLGAYERTIEGNACREKDGT